MTAAIDRSMAVISFNTEGEVLKANANFLKATGYREEEVIGQHHRMFCTPELRNSRSIAHSGTSLTRRFCLRPVSSYR